MITPSIMKDEERGAERLHERFTELNERLSNYGFDPFEPSGSRWLDVWVRSWAEHQAFRLMHTMNLWISRCESQIEKMFLIALTHAAQTNSLPVDEIFVIFAASDRDAAERHPSDWKLLIEPQARIGEYRVDFQIDYWCSVFGKADDENKIRPFRPRLKTNKFRLFIECDGHDFHERTKEQAARDRKRDRDLQQLGFNVLRFTGSEIWKDPMAPALEVLDFFLNKPYSE